MVSPNQDTWKYLVGQGKWSPQCPAVQPGWRGWGDADKMLPAHQPPGPVHHAGVWTGIWDYGGVQSDKAVSSLGLPLPAQQVEDVRYNVPTALSMSRMALLLCGT